MDTEEGFAILLGRVSTDQVPRTRFNQVY